MKAAAGMQKVQQLQQMQQQRPLLQLHRAPPRRAAVACRAAASGKVATAELRRVAEEAAAAGAEVVKAALAAPRAYTNKSGAIGDIVTATDKAAEAAVIAAIQAALPGHSILGEESGLVGDGGGDYLWIVDPLDGTCNFAHLYPGFCVSVGVLRHALPVAGCVIEFVGGPGAWRTRRYSAGRNLGATLDGAPLCVSEDVRKLEDALVVTEFVFYDDLLWDTQAALLRDFATSAMGVRAGGAAATNLCHVAAGIVDGYYQFNLKPWDVTAGAVILEEAGGRITTADGNAYSVFDRSLLATNDALYTAMLAMTEGPTQAAIRNGAQLGPANIPAGFKVRAGAQLE